MEASERIGPGSYTLYVKTVDTVTCSTDYTKYILIFKTLSLGHFSVYLLEYAIK